MKTLMEIKKTERILLEDKVLDWLQIWTAASSLDVKGNKTEFFFLTNRLVSQIRSHMHFMYYKLLVNCSWTHASVLRVELCFIWKCSCLQALSLRSTESSVGGVLLLFPICHVVYLGCVVTHLLSVLCFTSSINDNFPPHVYTLYIGTV